MGSSRPNVVTGTFMIRWAVRPISRCFSRATVGLDECANLDKDERVFEQQGLEWIDLIRLAVNTQDSNIWHATV
jgi:hypothetical protein